MIFKSFLPKIKIKSNYMKMNTPEEKQLLKQFEIVNGCTSDMFDDKDWVKFERFCERQYNEEELEMLEVPMPIYKQETLDDYIDDLLKVYSDIDKARFGLLIRAGAKWAQAKFAKDIRRKDEEIELIKVKLLHTEILSKASQYTEEDIREAIDYGADLGLEDNIGNSFQWTAKQNEFISRKKEEK